MNIDVVFEEFTPRDPRSKPNLSANFGTTKVLGVNTITACTWYSVPIDGTDPDAAAMIDGLCDVSATPIVKQKIKNGVSGVTYRFDMVATLSDGQIIVGAGVQKCVDGA